MRRACGGWAFPSPLWPASRRKLSQALAKIQRGHDKDLADVRGLAERGLIDLERLRALFAEIEPALYRYPAIDPTSFRRAVEDFVAGHAPPPVHP